jgi:hypothetical protein
MKRIFHLAMCTFFLLPAAVAPAMGGEILDSVVATVNHKPIFHSDWDEAVCYEMFMQRKPLAEVTETERVTALQRLIDLQLLKAQMNSASALLPSRQELQNDVAKLRAQVPEGNNDQSWQKLLASYGLDENRLKEHLQTEVQIMNFVEVRLRPHIHISPEEVEAYYRDQLLPDLEKAGGQVIALPDVEPKIRELLTQRRMDEMLDIWLHNLRQQAEIHTPVPIPALNAPADQAAASGIQ